MSKKTSKPKSAQPARPQFVINLDDMPDRVQMAVNNVSNWYGCSGTCFPLVGRWWDV